MSDKHFLVVEPFDPDDDTDRFGVEHPDGCPRVDLDCPPELGEAWRYDCEVEYHLGAGGVETWFRHADDPDPFMDSAEPVTAGRHEIEPWSHHQPATPWSGEEWYGGLRLADTPGGAA